MIKNIIVKGIGFDSGGDSTTKFIPTHGFSSGAAAAAAGRMFADSVGPGMFAETTEPNMAAETAE